MCILTALKESPLTRLTFSNSNFISCWHHSQWLEKWNKRSAIQRILWTLFQVLLWEPFHKSASPNCLKFWEASSFINIMSLLIWKQIQVCKDLREPSEVILHLLILLSLAKVTHCCGVTSVLPTCWWLVENECMRYHGKGCKKNREPQLNTQQHRVATVSAKGLKRTSCVPIRSHSLSLYLKTSHLFSL